MRINGWSNLERTIDHHNLRGRLFLGQGVEDHVRRPAEQNTVCAHLLGRADVEVRIWVGLDIVVNVSQRLQAATFEVLGGSLNGNDIVTMRAALDGGDARCHDALRDN